MAGSGGLRTYLGTAPGVGKTYAMLGEGQRRADGGDRVVIGWVEEHGRPGTKAQLRGLQIVSPRMLAYRGTTGAGMVESVPDEFVRSGEVVLVDLPPEALRQRIATGQVFRMTPSAAGSLSTRDLQHPPHSQA
jgi:two-component system, OmpR family, sensor histidine kinase KdpD